MAGPFDDDPRPEHDDKLCVDAWCPYEAPVEDGERISFCQEHLQKYARYVHDGAWGLAEMKERPNVVHSALLSLRERAWLPQTADEQGREWPSGTSKIEAFSGCFVHQLDGAGDDEWTWRSVAMAMRAFPDRPIRLIGSSIYIPQVPPLPVDVRSVLAREAEEAEAAATAAELD